MTILKLPVTSDGSRNFITDIGGKNYRFRTYYNRLDGWYIDIYDDLENPIIVGIALNVGIDLLRQHTGNEFGHEIIYHTTDNSQGDKPNDLGEIAYPLVTVNAE